MKFKLKSLAIPVVVSALLVAGCSSTEPEKVGETEGEADYEISLAVVPGQDIGLIYVPEVQDIFAEHGITLEVTEVGGQDVVDGVVDGDFDLAYAAYVPPILALADGADLKVISGLSNLGPAGSNGSTIVGEDSGISTWADLEGKKVAVASAKSFSTLGLEASMAKDGVEGAMELVELDPGKIGDALDSGEVDAGDLVQPYASAAMNNYKGFEDIGDAKEYGLGEGTPLSAFFTTTSEAEANSEAFDAFKEALDESVEFGNDNPDKVKEGAAGQAGLSVEVSLDLPTSVYASSATAEELQPLIDTMIDLGWIDDSVDVSEFAAG